MHELLGGIVQYKGMKRATTCAFSSIACCILGILAAGAGDAARAANQAPSFSLPTAPLGQAGSTWTALAGSSSTWWGGIASSADGSKLAAVEFYGRMYTSADSGVTWTARVQNPGGSWSCIACSTDGLKIAAAGAGYLYSSPNGGATWYVRMADASRFWNTISMSADGTRVLASAQTGLFLSIDSGTSWTQLPIGSSASCTACSADGMKMMAVVDGALMTSTNGGVTWALHPAIDSTSPAYWNVATSSADGSRLVAASFQGKIYTSTDFGATWTARLTDADRAWLSITSSTDGMRLAAVQSGDYRTTPPGNGNVYLSMDGGVSWALHPDNESLNWTSVASSADGTRLVAGVDGGKVQSSTGIYTLTVTGPPGAYSQAGFATAILAGPAADAGQTVSFTVTNDNNALFSVQPAIDSLGRLTFTRASSGAGMVAVTVVAHDNGGTANGGVDTSAPKVFNIMLPIYSVPADIALSQATLLESSPVGTVVGTFAASNPNPADSHVFTLVSGAGSADNARFSIAGNVLMLSTAITQPVPSSYSIRVRATDNGGATFEKVFVIAVIYVNHAPSFALPSATGSATGYPWTTRLTAKAHNWSDIASSADGSRIAAATTDGTVYLSGDFGTTWVRRQVVPPQATKPAAVSFACSADGSRLALAVWQMPVYTSNDFGMTWTAQPASGSQFWTSISMSGDGTRLFAASGGYLYTSADAGVTWTAHLTDLVRSWSQVAGSADGTKLAAIEYDGQLGTLFTSVDAGTTWNARFNKSNINLAGIASSADGSRLVVSGIFGQIYVSNGPGGDLTARMTDANRAWGRVASSADGARLVALLANGPVYASADFGVSWTAQASGSRTWRGVTSSADGTRLAVIESSGYLYTSSNLSPLSVAGGSGPYSQAGFATAISAGAATESAQTLAFTVTSSNPALFSVQPTIDSSGRLTFTPAPNTSGTVVLNVTLKDSGGTANGGVDTSVPQQFLLIITPDHSPTGLASSTASLLENNVPGAVVATLGATDADLVDPVTFTLEEGPGDTDNGTFSITGNALRLNVMARAEAQSSYSVRVRATNAAGGYYEKVLTFAVVNVNEPPVFALPASPAEAWTPRESNRNWKAVACSADGVKIVAAVNGGYLYTSADSGVSWSPRAVDASRLWTAVASSADGTKLVALASTGEIHTSADYGLTWVRRVSGQSSWISVACSADGTRLVAADVGASAAGGYLYVSADSGATWTARVAAGQRVWQAVTSSADGTQLLAGVKQDLLYYSLDSGATWATRSSSLTRNWISLASSADGSRLLAAPKGGDPLVSVASGWTWSDRYFSGVPLWTSTASSASGERMAAVGPGAIYLSQNFGWSWEPRMVDATRSWSGVACSADGTKLVAVAAGGQIYTSMPVAPYSVILATNTTSYSQAGFAYGNGAFAGEYSQAVSFIVTDDNPALFTVQPAIDSQGNLTFTHVAGKAGIATVTVVAKDNGGTANGGVDTSAPRTFIVQFVNAAISVEQPAGAGLQDGVSSVAFGSVGVGGASTQTFTIKNIGPYNLSGLNISKTGNNTADFTVGPPGTTSVMTMDSTTFVVTFKPAASGARSAVIHINSSSVYGAGDTFDITLTGTGVNPVVAGWRSTHFGSSNTDVGDNEDFNHDGVPNVVELAFGTAPESSAGSGRRPLQYIGTLAGGGTIGQTGQPISLFEGANHCALWVRRKDYASAGLNYTPQFSADMSTWTASASTVTVLADDGTNQIVCVPYPAADVGHQGWFFRVSVGLGP